MPAAPTILIACIGNIFLGDDGFGVEVARRLSEREHPPGVTVRDFGIRGFDVAYALMEPFDHVVLVDACARGGAPGSVYVIEPEMPRAAEALMLDAHSLTPGAVLRMVTAFGGRIPNTLVVGCEPENLGGGDEGHMGLSQPVANAVDEAVRVIETLIVNLRNDALESAAGFLRLEAN